MIFFGQNRLISRHNIDKNDIFIERNINFQGDMLQYVSKLSFSIRRGTSPLFITAPHPAYDRMRLFAGICGQHT